MNTISATNWIDDFYWPMHDINLLCNLAQALFEVVKLFWPRVYSISNTDIPIHLGSIHRCMNAA